MKIVEGGIKKTSREAIKYKQYLEEKYGKNNVISTYEDERYTIIAVNSNEEKEIEER